MLVNVGVKMTRSEIEEVAGFETKLCEVVLNGGACFIGDCYWDDSVNVFYLIIVKTSTRYVVAKLLPREVKSIITPLAKPLPNTTAFYR